MQPQDESSVELRIDPLAQHKHLPAVLNHLERQLGCALALVHNPLKTRLIDQKASSGHQPTCTCVLCSSARDYGIVSTPRITFLAMPSKLIVLAASNGENLKLAQRFAEKARALGHTADVLDLTTVELPVFTPRVQAKGTPHAISALEQQLMAAQRWVICAPEYNGSIPPVLTNAIAWLSVTGDDFRALFNGRPIAMATFSGGGGMELLVSLRIQLTHLGAQVVGRQLLSNHAKPAQEDSISDLVQRLLQMQPLQL